jgi:hypothetical protein
MFYGEKTIERLTDAARIMRAPPPDSVNRLRFHLSQWGRHETKDHEPLDQNACGTTVCAWGKIAVTYALRKLDDAPKIEWRTDCHNTKELLIMYGLSDDDIKEMTAAHDWTPLAFASASNWFGLDQDWLEYVFVPSKFDVDIDYITEEMVARRFDYMIDALKQNADHEGIAFERFRRRCFQDQS